jgi:DNA-binding transcriptional MerR regulator
MSNHDHHATPAGPGRADPRYSDEECGPADDVLSIENVAKRFKLRKLTLRYYEFRGLIVRRHHVGRTRVYDWTDCGRIAFIIKCRKAGITLGEIAPVILSARGDGSARSVKLQLEQCIALIDRLERRRQTLDSALAELRHVYTLNSSDRKD